MNINPDQIVDTVKRVPPYQQKETESGYVGQKVSWVLKFNSVYEREGDLRKIMTHTLRGYPWVYFEVDINDYPMFKLLHQNKLIKVNGTISDVAGHSIDLEKITSIELVEVKKIIKIFLSKINLFNSFVTVVLGVMIGGILYMFGWV